jgi:hypothetical protein
MTASIRLLLSALWLLPLLFTRASAEEGRAALIMGVGDYDGRFGLKALPGIGLI